MIEAADQEPVVPRIARLLAPYRSKLILVAVAVVAAATLTSVVPFLTRAVFDKALFPPGGGDPNFHLLGWLAAGMIAI
ncbi:MAG: multidrug transporter ATPase, partial [Nocardioidaceae bacterium]|nr:multidrug transporter ATPase [Nocardioidaceae bacterium]